MWVISQDGMKLVYCNAFKIEVLKLKSYEDIFKKLWNETGAPDTYIRDYLGLEVDRKAKMLYESSDNDVCLITGTTTLGNIEELAKYSTKDAALRVMLDLGDATDSKQAFIFVDDVKVVE